VLTFVQLRECAHYSMFTELTLMQIEQAEADDNDEDEEIVEDDVAGGKLSTLHSLGI
jgi:hypothetical protein